MADNKLGYLIYKQCQINPSISCKISDFILKVVPICLLIIGTVGNSLNIALLCRKTFRTKPVFMLLFLAIFDIVFLWTNIPTHLRLYFSGIYFPETSTEFCRFDILFSIWSSICSLWTVSYVTLLRAIAVLSRTQQNTSQNRKKHLGFLLGIFAVSFLLACISIFSGELNICDAYAQNLGDLHISIFILGVLVIVVVPILITIIGNVILVRVLYRRKELVSNTSNTDGQTKVIVLLTTLMIVCMVPYVIFSAYVRFGLDSRTSDISSLSVWMAVVACLFWSNYTFNFVCYLWSGTLFKKEIRTMASDVKSFFSKRSASVGPQNVAQINGVPDIPLH